MVKLVKFKNNKLLPFVIFLLVSMIAIVMYIGIPSSSPTCKSCNYSHSNISHVNTVAEIIPVSNIAGISTRNSPAVVIDPYGPPLRNDGVFFPRDSGDIRGGIPVVPCKCGSCNLCLAGVPINIETRGMPMEFTQVGILTRGSGKGEEILSLMGRKLMTGSDKWQYYTYTNSGIMPTKVSVYVNGRDGMGEYGLDRLYSGDHVFVDGYEEVYRTKMYENSQFRYIPFL